MELLITLILRSAVWVLTGDCPELQGCSDTPGSFNCVFQEGSVFNTDSLGKCV